jgi:hypothetical protein
VVISFATLFVAFIGVLGWAIAVQVLLGNVDTGMCPVGEGKRSTCYLDSSFTTLLFSCRPSASSTTESLPTDWQLLANDVVSMMDNKTDPCTDFYQYACGRWIEQTPLPPGVGNLNPSFEDLEKKNEERILEIVDEEWPLISDFFSR